MAFRVQMIGDFTLEEEIKGIFLDWKLFKKEFIMTGRNVHGFMIEYLKANSQGTSNASGIHLHNEIDFNYIDSGKTVIVEIGDIAKLNAIAPWMWKLVNDGGAHPMAKYSEAKRRYVPNSKLAGRYKSKFPTGMVVSTNARIKGIHYIENTEHFGTAAYQRLIAISTT